MNTHKQDWWENHQRIWNQFRKNKLRLEDTKSQIADWCQRTNFNSDQKNSDCDLYAHTITTYRSHKMPSTVVYIGVGDKARPNNLSARSKAYKHNIRPEDPKVHILLENLTSKQADAIETKLIEYHGQLLDNAGTLINIQKESVHKRHHEATKKKLTILGQERWNNLSDEEKKLHSDQQLGDKNPMWGKEPWHKGTTGLKSLQWNEERKQKRSVLMKKRWTNLTEEEKALQLSNLKRNYEPGYHAGKNNPMWGKPAHNKGKKMPYKEVQCPYCLKKGRHQNVPKKSHFENCLEHPNPTIRAENRLKRKAQVDNTKHGKITCYHCKTITRKWSTLEKFHLENCFNSPRNK